MSEVLIDESGIRHQWHEREGDALDVMVAADMPIGDLVRVVDEELKFVRQATLLDTIGFSSMPGPTPQGAAVSMSICDDLEDTIATLRLLGTRLQMRGIDGQMVSRTLEHPQIGHPRWQMLGFTAGLVTTGKTSGDDEFVPEISAKVAIRDHALEWCAVPKGQTWIQAETTSARIPWERRSEFLDAAAFNRASAWGLVSEDGEYHARRVMFLDKGHVVYQIGGVPGPSWNECVEDLRAVVTDLSAALDYACVVKSRISRTLWQEIPMFLWEPYRQEFKFNQHSMNRASESVRVPGVFGIQLLGPGHPKPALPGQWQSRQLALGHTLIEHKDLAAWYAQPPTVELLGQSRADFGDIVVDNIRPH